MSENNPLNCRIVLEDSAPFLKEIAKLLADNVELQRKLNTEGFYGRLAAKAGNERDKLKAENDELRKLVREGFFEAWTCLYDTFPEDKAWEQWSTQHPILKEQP